MSKRHIARQTAASWTIAALLLGCSHQVRETARPATPVPVAGEVTGTAIEPNASERYEINASDPAYYEQPTDYPDNPSPAYPSPLLAQRLPPATVRVRVVVNESGRVTQVQQLDADGADLHSDEFIASVQSTVAGWKYLPLVKVTPGEEHTTLYYESNSFSTYSGKAVALPFHKDYEFTFRQVDGRGSVEIR